MKWVLGLLMLALLCCSEADVQTGILVVTGPEKPRVVADADYPAHYKGAQTIAELQVGDTVPVFKREILKDCMVCQVKLPDGRRGWVAAGDNCRVINLP